NPDLTQGIQLYNRKQYAAALQILAKAKAAEPGNPTVYYYQALCFQLSNQSDQATRVFEKICTTFPRSREARLSRVYLDQLDEQAETVAMMKKTAPPPPQRPAPDLASFAAANLTDEELDKLPDRTAVPFTRGPNGHLFVNITINGRPMNVMFDTGASICLFGKNNLQQAGITPSTEGRRVALAGVGSTTNYGQAMVVDLGVGSMIRHMPIIVEDHLEGAPLLGETFFNGFKYDIDNQAGLIRFTKKTRPGAVSHGGSDIPFDTINVPFLQVGNNMVVDAVVEGRPCKMYFDTGASLIAFTMSKWRSMGLSVPPNAEPSAVTGVGGTSAAFSFQISELKVGSLTKRNVPVTIVNQSGMGIPLLGQPFFQDRRFTIDNENHLIRFFR
ncbi:MAG TPA: retroviral-like aspartic protease family protein, partial [Chroococcales cyanobacterium]